METINKNNYEAYFLDYYEKNLSAEQVAELMLFLENNPQFKEEFIEYEEIVLEPEENIVFENKASLKKEVYKTVGNITSENYEDYIIADIENQITLKERNELSNFIKENPNSEKDYNLYKLTVLQPDLTVIFPGKKSLKKPLGRTIRPFAKRLYYATAIAASAAVLIGMFFLNGNQNNMQTNAFASRETKIEMPERSIYQEQIAESPIRKKYPKVNKSKQRENIIIERVNEKTDIQLASNFDNYIPEINYNFDFYNSEEFIQLFQNRYEEELAMEEEGKADFQDLKNYLAVGVNKIIRPEAETPDTLRKLNGWDIADIGISGINKLSKQTFDLKKEKAEDGSVQSFTFSASNFEFSRQLKKKNK